MPGIVLSSNSGPQNQPKHMSAVEESSVAGRGFGSKGQRGKPSGFNAGPLVEDEDSSPPHSDSAIVAKARKRRNDAKILSIQPN